MCERSAPPFWTLLRSHRYPAVFEPTSRAVACGHQGWVISKFSTLPNDRRCFQAACKGYPFGSTPWSSWNGRDWVEEVRRRRRSFPHDMRGLCAVCPRRARWCDLSDVISSAYLSSE